MEKEKDLKEKEEKEKENKKKRAKMTRYSPLFSTVPKKRLSPPRV